VLVSKDEVETELPAAVENFADIFGNKVLELIYKQEVWPAIGSPPSKSRGQQLID
jgi:hypothetical protein